jgi:alpha-tubulin suppressor-like RCC1 family protein
MQKSIQAGSSPPSRDYERAIPLPPISRTSRPNEVARPKKIPPRVPLKEKQKRKQKKKIPSLAKDCSLAMSRTESVLVSASGDVMVCRCRRSSTPYLDSHPGPDSTPICCEPDFSSAIGVSDFISTIDIPWSNRLPDKAADPSCEASIFSGVSSYEWEKPLQEKDKHMLGKIHSKSEPERISVDPPEVGFAMEAGVELLLPSVKNVGDTSNDEDMGIIAMPSFDYTHMDTGGNDMIAPKSRMQRTPSVSTIQESPYEEKKDESEVPSKPFLQPFFHGVPVFLSSLSQIRITKVSANPLGAHVLMISAEALLLTYGLNNHGQLGIGIKSNLRDGTRGFITSPSLVTPLLENGGKTINCAAGVDHSLVVVSTEGRRLQKLQTKNVDETHSDIGVVPLRLSSSQTEHDDDESTHDSAESVLHHQVYGFGKNNFMKLGLVYASLSKTAGISENDEDIMLPHRVALHCTVWPQENTDSSLPPQGIFDIAASTEHSAALVRRPTGDIEVYVWGNASLGALGKFSTDGEEVTVKGRIAQKPTSNVSNVFPHPTVIDFLSWKSKESKLGYPRSLALGPYCSFVLMSSGRCMSFGFSAEGMLGQGFGLKHISEPKEVFITAENGQSNAIVSISAGACHAICITEDGGTFAWGVDKDGRLGIFHDGYKASSDQGTVEIEWVPQRIDVRGHSFRTRTSSEEDSMFCVKACAGYDSSLLVMRSGQVLSFGKKSGRLGKGEVEGDVLDPQPLHGGLCLFHHDEKEDVEEAENVEGGTVNRTIPKRKIISRIHSVS